MGDQKVNLKDVSALSEGSVKSAGDEKSCKTCHESWEIPPTTRELKRGVIDSVMVCLAKSCQQQLTDGTYPRLASLCRNDKALCGGKLWRPIGPALIADRPARLEYHPRPKPEEVKRPQGKFDKRRRMEEEELEHNRRDNKKKDKFRKPYKVA